MYGKIQTKKLLKKLEEKDISYLLVMNLDLPQLDPNFYYFTGLDGYEHSIALLGEKSRVYVPSFEVPRAKRESSIRDIRKTKAGLTKELGKFLNNKKVGINGEFMPVNFQKKLKRNKIKLVDASKIIEELRVIKNKEEVERIKKAASLSKKVLKKVDISKSETQIVADLIYEYARHGMKPGYDPIVAFDGDSTVPHFIPTNKRGGKTLLIDAAAAYKNYTADITRTFLLKPTKEMKKVYEIVKEVHDLAIDMVEPGVKASEIDNFMQDFLKKKGYSCPHSIGHGIGLLVHERPYISIKSDEILKEGMTFTIEPGVYITGKFGIRIEDDILVTKSGHKIL